MDFELSLFLNSLPALAEFHGIGTDDLDENDVSLDTRMTP